MSTSEHQELDLECDNRLHPGDLALELPIYLCCLYPCWTCMVPKVRGIPAEATLMPEAEQWQLLDSMQGEWKILPMHQQSIVYETATIDGSRMILSGGSHRGRKGRSVQNPTQVHNTATAVAIVGATEATETPNMTHRVCQNNTYSTALQCPPVQ